jgi:hypothetical protein
VLTDDIEAVRLKFYRTHNEEAKVYNAPTNDQMNLLSPYDSQTNEPVCGLPKALARIERMEG